MIFVNTRPASRGVGLSQYLSAQGVEVVALPLLALVVRELTTNDKLALQQLLADRYQAVIVVSETAVKYGLDQLALLTDAPIIHTTFVAVGETTANLLQQGWQAQFATPCPPIVTPTQAQLPENNDGMLALQAVSQLVEGDNVLLWRGVGGRTLLADTLKSRGVLVDSIAFYQRQLPSDSLQQWQQFYDTHLATEQPIWVLISSLTAWQHWQQLVATTPVKLNRFGYIALQSRIAAHIQGSGIDRLQVVDNLQPNLIHQALLNNA